jgi:hypothetical protein
MVLTERTPLELLDRSGVFEQTRLMPPARFRAQCERRGVWMHLSDQMLDALEQAGLLRPLYRYRRDLRSARGVARSEPAALHGVLHFQPTDPALLRKLRDTGKLFNRADDLPKSWHSYRREFDGQPVQTAEFLYSQYQLLGIDVLKPILHSRLRARRRADEALRYQIRLGRWDLAGLQGIGIDLVVLLSALEPFYRPQVVHQVIRSIAEGEDARRTYEDRFDPLELAAWLRVDIGALKQTAEGLLTRARSIDPIGDWIDLVRMVATDRLERLKGDALTALDYRIASEMLLLFYEDLAAQGCADSLPAPRPPFARDRSPLDDDRLRRDPASIDAVLTKYGLSPHPGTVLVLEGLTELVLVPKVMAELGFTDSRSLVRLVAVGGVNWRLQLLAAYAATPMFGLEYQDFVFLDAPPTHVLIAFDPDQGYDTEERRERLRRKIVERIMETVPDSRRTETIRAQVDQMVETHTWDGSQIFEYANFTDGEIAVAMNRMYRRRGGGGNAISASMLRAMRPRGDPARLWRAWPSPGSKVELAEELWPALQRRLKRAAAAERLADVPVARVVLRAIDLAIRARRARAMRTQEVAEAKE